MSIQYPKIVTNTFHAFLTTRGNFPTTKNPNVHIMSLPVATKLNTVVNMVSSRDSASTKEGVFHSQHVYYPWALWDRFAANHSNARATAASINAVSARHTLPLHACSLFSQDIKKNNQMRQCHVSRGPLENLPCTVFMRVLWVTSAVLPFSWIIRRHFRLHKNDSKTISWVERAGTLFEEHLKPTATFACDWRDGEAILNFQKRQGR